MAMRLFVALLAATLLPYPALAQTPEVEKSIKSCVELVHKIKAKNQFEDEFYKNFDAFYNPATGLIQNNAYRNGDREPLYRFNKCMTERGVSLSSGASPKNSNDNNSSIPSVAAYLMQEPVTMMDWGIKGLNNFLTSRIEYINKNEEKIAARCKVSEDTKSCDGTMKIYALAIRDVNFDSSYVTYDFQNKRIDITSRAATDENDEERIKDILTEENCKNAIRTIRDNLVVWPTNNENQRRDAYERLFEAYFSHSGFKTASEPKEFGLMISDITFISVTLQSSWNGKTVNCSSGFAD
jgi:hypothetical protein